MIINNLKDKFLLKSINQRPEILRSSLGDSNTKLYPIGNNKMDADKLFFERKEYEIAFNDYVNSINSYAENSEDPNAENKLDIFKDTIYKHNLYGKINFNNDVVEIKNMNQLKIINNKNNVMAINVVADMFNDIDRKSTRLNSSHVSESRMPSSA